MTTEQWLTCVNLLSNEFPKMAEKFGSPRWQERFIHVPYHAMRAAIEEYCDSSHQPPTVNSLAEKLPRGYSPKREAQQHAHAWESFGATVVCQSCGRHEPTRCACLRCQCNHLRAKPESESSDEWWHCPDCDSSFRAAPRRREQYAKQQVQAEAESFIQQRKPQALLEAPKPVNGAQHEGPIRHTPDPDMWRYASDDGDDSDIPF